MATGADDARAGDLARRVFEATWDLLTRSHRRERVTAATFSQRFSRAEFARPDVGPALLAAELRAGIETAGFADLLRTGDRPPDSYPYLHHPSDSADLGRFADFRVVREVGRGGMGVVFEAVHGKTALTDDRRALKVLPPDKADATARERFLAEANNQVRVRNPNAVAVYGASTAETPAGPVAYIEMDFVYGPTLHDLIEHFHGAEGTGGRVPVPLAVDLVRQTAAGLAAAHACDPPVAHRDVKPSNVLLLREKNGRGQPDWRALLCDFGLSRAEGQCLLTSAGAVVGTTPYLPPERTGLRPADPAGDARPGDVFSLGTVLYELVAGSRPFTGDTADDIRASIAWAEPPSPRILNPAFPEGVERLIVRMLAKEPRDRPSADDVAKDLLDSLAQSGPTTAVDAVKTAAGDPPPGRRVRALASVAVAALVGAVVVVELAGGKAAVEKNDRGGVLTGGGPGETIDGKGNANPTRDEPERPRPGEWPVRVVKPAMLYSHPVRDERPSPPLEELDEGMSVTLIGDIRNLKEKPRCLVRLSDGTEVWVPSSCLDKD